MPRTYVLRDAYAKLTRMSLHLRVRSAPLLSYLIEEHSRALTDDNTYLVDDYEKVQLKDIQSVNVTRTAAYVAAEASALLRIKVSSFVSFVVYDNLPALEAFPDNFPGVRDLQKNRGSRRGGAYAVVNVSKAVYTQVKNRVEVLNNNLPIGMVVSSILQSVPYEEVVSVVLEEDFIRHLRKMFPQTSLRSIRIAHDIHSQITDICAKLGVKQWRLTSFFLKRDLDASDMEIKVGRDLLPQDPKKRWTVLLRDILETGVAKPNKRQ